MGHHIKIDSNGNLDEKRSKSKHEVKSQAIQKEEEKSTSKLNPVVEQKESDLVLTRKHELATFRKPGFIVPFIALILIALGSSAFFYLKAQSQNSDIASLQARLAEIEKQQKVQEDPVLLNEEVSKIYMVPNEVPNIVTVLDNNLLKGQEFFNNAKNGDKVLVYPNAKEAILYRPADKKIIKVAPLVVDLETSGSVAGVSDKQK